MSFSNYETIYILKPDIEESENLSLVNAYKFFIKERGGKNIYIQHRGKRHLSYTIQDHYDGIYVQMNYTANGRIVNLLEKSMKFDDNIIRFLTVKQNLLNKINIY